MSASAAQGANGSGGWQASRRYGKYRGIVTDNADPNNLGRLRARVPEVLGDVESGWALPAAPYAGDGLGSFMVPPAEAGVWIEFESGDVSRPIWTGCWWSSDQLPQNEAGTAATPPLKIVRTENGLMVSMDDDGQTISVSDENGDNILKIEVQAGQITVKGAQKAVVEAPAIEVVENASHPVVFGDSLLQYLQQVVQMYGNHMHPGQQAGPYPVVPTPPQPPLPTPPSSMNSQKVKVG
jgi:uncharacterized protein involved in type VI secretion and phage assembly